LRNRLDYGRRPHLRIPTPALLADLDAVDHNVTEISRSLRGKRATLRPHFKNHTVVALAKQQVEAGLWA
jgi:D-serine deaminase-like pyridoxal phosphate-dependent protein